MWWRTPVICNLGSGGRDQSLATEGIKASMGPMRPCLTPNLPPLPQRKSKVVTEPKGRKR